MRIDPAGNVGIGTISPSATLEVIGVSQTGLKVSTDTNNPFEYAIAAENSGTGDVAGFFLASNTAGGQNSHGVYGQANGAGAGVFGGNDGTIGVAGKFMNFNAGNTNPVVNILNNGSGPAIEIGNYGEPHNNYISIKTSGGNLYKAGVNFRHFNDTDGFTIESDEIVNQLRFKRYDGAENVAMSINRLDGYVGIGTTAIPSFLTVAGNAHISGNADIGSGLIFPSSIDLSIDDNDTGLNVPGDGQLAFFADNIEVARITNSGSLGIGTTTPTAKLDIAGQIRIADGSQGSGKVLTSDADGFATWQPAGAGSGWGLTGNSGTVDGTNFIGTTDDVPLAFRVNNVRAGLIQSATPFSTFFGYQAGLNNGAAQNNTAIGYQALSVFTSSSNTAVGFQAMQNSNGGQNTAVGDRALQQNTNGSGNTALGMAALANPTSTSNNTAVGLFALSQSTGSGNVAMGSFAASFNTTGSNNVFVGNQAGYPNANVSQANETGSNNTFLGANTGLGSSTQLTNATAIGANAIVDQDNSLVLGSIAGLNGASSSVNVGIGTTAPTAKLDIAGSIKIVDGTQAAGKVLTSDANGLASWQAAGVGSGWVLTGNALTTPGTNFIGTTDAQDLVFKTNNTEQLRIKSNGYIWTKTNPFPPATLLPELELYQGGAESTQARLVGLPNQLQTLQLFGQNSGTGAVQGWALLRASDETLIMTNNAGAGIGSLTSTHAMIISANGNTLLGPNGPANSKLDIEGNLAVGATYAGSGGTAAPANGAIIEGSVGIGTITPATKLDVNGNAFIRGTNTNTAPTISSGLELLVGRSNSGTLISGQSSADIAFNWGGASGGYRHFIQTRHNSVANSNTNSIDFYVNNSATQTGSVAPNNAIPNGNSLAMSMTAVGVGIGTTAPNAQLQLSNTLANRKLVLYESANNDHQFYGFGVVSGQLRYQIANNSGAAHIFYAATGTTTSLALMSVGQNGNVSIAGNLSKGSGTFKIDHPQDPENKFLYHSFVESPDMMNVYNGNVQTDTEGNSVIELPAYFESLNKDFRYQLTVIGQFAQVIVSEEIKDNKFSIKTDKPNVKVSWQVTGIRKDPFAEKNRVIPEVEKSAEEKGKYLHAEAYGQPIEKKIGYETQPMHHQ